MTHADRSDYRGGEIDGSATLNLESRPNLDEGPRAHGRDSGTGQGSRDAGMETDDTGIGSPSGIAGADEDDDVCLPRERASGGIIAQQHNGKEVVIMRPCDDADERSRCGCGCACPQGFVAQLRFGVRHQQQLPDALPCRTVALEAALTGARVPSACEKRRRHCAPLLGSSG
ncbi:hypothetical protein AXG93_461s1100 [Marchantia polymorpha subsp. ruderalis]|uniref:Uncharacterized protein n=1 Tax=Marchantia polymorpha subsp. ruderalis TaxID=1480154 RepID=A0A176VDN4_MARPO|nr:hypothetical protein AXG93_461s1100 [Marchantia polymorpha subsp. ruderalis]